MEGGLLFRGPPCTSKMHCSSAYRAVKLCTADLSVTTDVKFFFGNKILIKFINNEIIIVANINNKTKIKRNIIRCLMEQTDSKSVLTTDVVSYQHVMFWSGKLNCAV